MTVRDVSLRMVWHRGAARLAGGVVLLAIGSIWAGFEPQPLLASLRDDDAPRSLPLVCMLLGLLCLGWWFSGVSRLKLLLANGSVAPAQIDCVRGEHRAWRGQLVDYRFRGHDGAWHHGRQRLRSGSRLGRDLDAGSAAPCAVFDPGLPRQSWLLARADLEAS